MKTGGQKGNSSACKPFKRDGRLNVRFNKELKARAVLEASNMGLNLTDYIELCLLTKLMGDT